MRKRLDDSVDWRGVRTGLATAVILGMLTLAASRISDLSSGTAAAVVLAIMLGGVAGIGYQRLLRRLTEAEKQIRYPNGPFAGHSRIDHFETELSLVRADALLESNKEVSAVEADMRNVIAAALVAGFAVKWELLDELPGSDPALKIVPPPLSGIPGTLVLPFAKEPTRDMVDDIARWVQSGGAPLKAKNVGKEQD